MNRLLLSVFTFAVLGLQAQIFINAEPIEKTNTSLISDTVSTTQIEAKTSSFKVKNTTSVDPIVAAAPVTTTSNLNITEDVPPNAEPGKCYARCLIENKYNFVNESAVNQPKMISQMKLPALYKTVYDTVVITPATTKYYTVPAEFDYINEEVMLSPTTQKWIKGKADVGCLSANPADCQVMCLVEVPATYTTVERKVLKNKAYTREESMPMQYKIVSKEVLIEAEKLVQVETPATYKTVQRRVLVEQGGYQVWREVLCGNDLTTEKISQIQKALKSNGYNPGPMNDVFGPLTKAALMQYQKDKSLPLGNLNLETLKHLGVN